MPRYRWRRYRWRVAGKDWIYVEAVDANTVKLQIPADAMLEILAEIRSEMWVKVANCPVSLLRRA